MKDLSRLKESPLAMSAEGIHLRRLGEQDVGCAQSYRPLANPGVRGTTSSVRHLPTNVRGSVRSTASCAKALIYGVPAVVALPAREPVRAVGQQPPQLLPGRIPSRSPRMRKNSFGACSLFMS